MATIFEDTEKLNLETGEIVRESTTVYRKRDDEPDYVKLYVNAWCVFKEIKGINLKMLYKILPFMTYAEDGQIIGFTAFIKREIAKSLEWKESTALQRFNNEIKKIEKAGVLKSIGRDTYRVNPELIGKGKWKDIRKLRATFNLETGEVIHKYADSEETGE